MPIWGFGEPSGVALSERGSMAPRWPRCLYEKTVFPIGGLKVPIGENRGTYKRPVGLRRPARLIGKPWGPTRASGSMGSEGRPGGSRRCPEVTV